MKPKAWSMKGAAAVKKRNFETHLAGFSMANVNGFFPIYSINRQTFFPDVVSLFSVFIFLSFLFSYVFYIYIFFIRSFIRWFVGILHHMMSMRLSIRNHTVRPITFFCCDFAHYFQRPYTDLRRPIPLIRCARNIEVAHRNGEREPQSQHIKCIACKCHK